VVEIKGVQMVGQEGKNIGEGSGLTRVFKPDSPKGDKS